MVFHPMRKKNITIKRQLGLQVFGINFLVLFQVMGQGIMAKDKMVIWGYIDVNLIALNFKKIASFVWRHTSFTEKNFTWEY